MILSDCDILRLENALGEFETEVVVADFPADWLSANKNHVYTICKALPVNVLTDFSAVGVIYPRLLAYALARIHSFPETERKELLFSFGEKLSLWREADELTQLRDYRLQSDIIWDVLHNCNHQPFKHTTKVKIERFLALDTLNIVAMVLNILSDENHLSLFVSQRGPHAQSSVNLLQAILDDPSLGAQIRTPIMRSLLQLAKQSGLYPDCMSLRDVQKQGKNGVDWGAFGDIWKGELEGHAVAIKVMRVFQVSNVNAVLKAYTKEAVLWRQLSHPHVLPFYGAFRWSEVPPRLCLVSPWMENGNIVQYLERNPQADRQSLVLDIALGLEYLHNFDPPIIHGDLKGLNILITPSLRACVADFGLGRLMPDSQIQSTLQGGTLQWLAPELLEFDENNPSGGLGSLSSDIYAFGVVCHEIFTGHPPFHELNYNQVLAAIYKGRRPERPPLEVRRRFGLDDKLWELMVQCWGKNPTNRPSASAVVRKLSVWVGDRHRTDAVLSDWDTTVMSRLKSTLSVVPTFTTESLEGGGRPESGILRTPQTMTRPIGHPELPPLPEEGEDRTLHDTDGIHSITTDDLVIAVMGPTGTGKSSFINKATKQPFAAVGRGLFSCTQEIGVIRYPHPHLTGRYVVFVDTPGFDDSGRGDYDILKVLATWLAETYREKITLAGILFFHSIAETRMHGTPLLNLSMFEELCGPQALRNVVLTTTMWDKENQPIALQREGELREDFWQPMLARGCQMARFHYTHQSAWAIIDGFDISARRPMQVQEEIVDQKKNLRETAAYHVLVQWWEKIWTKFRATIFGGVKKRRALGSSSRGSSTSTLQQVVSGKEKKSEKQSFPSSMGEGSLRSRFLRRR